MRIYLILFLLYKVNFYAWKADTNVVSVKCAKKFHIKEGQLKIKVSYLNNSNDTILLPIGHFVFKNFQSVYFVNQEKCFCSLTSKRVWPSESEEPCDIEYMKKDGFAVIPPHQSVFKEFMLDSLGCVGCEFKKGKKYDYFVKLNVDSRFKNECDKVWTGQATSSKGSIIID